MKKYSARNFIGVDSSQEGLKDGRVTQVVELTPGVEKDSDEVVGEGATSSGFWIIDSIIPSSGSTTLILVVRTRVWSEAEFLADTTTSSSSIITSPSWEAAEEKVALSFFILSFVCASRDVRSVLLRESRERERGIEVVS